MRASRVHVEKPGARTRERVVSAEMSFAELNRLAGELKEIDPAAFDGYEGFLWPRLLDRWLY